MDIRGKIFNTQHYSIRDGHGIRTVVFLKGCILPAVIQNHKVMILTFTM